MCVFYPALVLAVALAAVLALPAHGVLVPGKSLGGVRLGAREPQVRAAWGPHVGVCRGCAHRTLYFTYGKFDEVGTGVEFRSGRAVALFTLGLPRTWGTDRGVALGGSSVSVNGVYGTLPRVECGHYYALVQRRGNVATAFYFKDDTLWAFGLMRASVPVCR
jgi:hypothetical protein